MFSITKQQAGTISAQVHKTRFLLSVFVFIARNCYAITVVLSFLMIARCDYAHAQAQQNCLTNKTDVPCIDKIDPPGWWIDLPDPMLLVHGNALRSANFTVSGFGVAITRTQVSENGHWAFLWLATQSADPQNIQVNARNKHGQTQQNFTLARRAQAQDTPRGFSSADVLYLIMTDRFARAPQAKELHDPDRSDPRGWHGGNMAGIENHLDYLQKLGVTALWMTPVASNAGMLQSYHGYAATDLYAVDPHFGKLEDYQHLSDAIHARGMKLVIDLVPNHIGVQHPWVLDSPAPDWLHGTLQAHRDVQGDFLTLVDPHAPIQENCAITNGWFTDGMPDLNQSNPLVSRYLIQNAMWWIETAHIDGIRLDTFPYVDRAFWHDFHAALHIAYPHMTTVGEIFHRDPEVTSFFAGGVVHEGIDTGLDTPFDFPTFFALRDVLVHGKPMTELATVLRQDSLYPHPERLVTFLGNHDTTRFITEANGSVPKLKLALGLITMLRGMPQLYSGDEISMPGEADPDNRHDFPGGIVAETRSAFRKTDRTATEEDVLSWTTGLLALRSRYPAVQTGLEQNLMADVDLFAFVRTPESTGCSMDHSSDPVKARLLVVVNKSQQSRTLELPMEETALNKCTQFHPLVPAMGTTPVPDSGKLHLQIAAESIAVYEVR
jgi:glycosidase